MTDTQIALLGRRDAVLQWCEQLAQSRYTAAFRPGSRTRVLLVANLTSNTLRHYVDLLTSVQFLTVSLSWVFQMQIVVKQQLHDSMLQITEAHRNWPVYADVFEHPPALLASRRPVWSDITSVDTIRHSYAVERGLVVGCCSQPLYCYRPYYLTARF